MEQLKLSNGKDYNYRQLSQKKKQGYNGVDRHLHAFADHDHESCKALQ